MDSETPAAPLPPQAICIGCGYDLAGLPEEGLCPECGSSIAESLRLWSNTNRLETPLREIAEGLRGIKVAYAILLVMGLLSTIAYAVEYSFPDLAFRLLVLSGLLFLPFFVVLMTGQVRVSTLLPDMDGRKRHINSSACIGVGTAGAVIGAIAAFPVGTSLGPIFLIGLVIAMIFGSLGLILVGMTLLARRLTPIAGSPWFLKLSAWGSTLSSAVCLACATLAAIAGLELFGSSIENLALLSIPIAAVAFFVSHAVLTLALERALKRILGDSPPPASPAAL